MKALKQSPVVFEPEQHTYHLDGAELYGVTGILSRQIFGLKYDGIPKDILKKAAEYGSLVHKQCELLDELGLVSNSEETWNYMRLQKDNHLEHVQSEYLVSDEEYVASSIDKVFKGEKDNEFIIADIKRTSKLDEEYLAWQLGFYKYLFELQNPDCKVTKCYGIWLRHDKSALVEITPKSEEECKELIVCDKAGKNYGELHDINLNDDVTLPQDLQELEAKLCRVIMDKKDLERKEADLKDRLFYEMGKANAKTWKGKMLTMTRKESAIRMDFDKKRFQKEHADLYGQYVKETTIAGGVSVRMQ